MLLFEVKMPTNFLYIIGLQGWRQEFSDGGADSSGEWLKYGSQGKINVKNLRKNRCLPSDGGASMLRRGL